MASSPADEADEGPSIPIPPPTAIDELRTGKLATFGKTFSGIAKDQRQGRLYVSKLGLSEDEHDLTFHGGPDKAIHQYCSDHYEPWRERYPEPAVAERFKPGGFGENFVASEWNEDNICVGDLVQVGFGDVTSQRDSPDSDSQGSILEVSLPRQPCFKLNQRFGIKNFAPVTHSLNRTGWYYRVVREGWIEKGMQLKIIDRRQPSWPISRLHHHVHRDKDDLHSMETLRNLPELGNECKSVFEGRWQKLQEKEKAATQKWRTFRLSEKRKETPRVQTFIFEAEEPEETPEDISASYHVTMKLPNGLKRSYSVVDGDSNRFQLGVSRDEHSRGGSVYMHDELEVGDHVEVASMVESDHHNPMASHHVFVAGGIGITAWLGLMKILNQINCSIELHYCVRSKSEIAFHSLFEPYASKVTIYDSSNADRLDISTLLKNRVWNSHFYVCGPQRMNDAFYELAPPQGVSEEEIVCERFQFDASGDPFTAAVQTSQEKTTVEVASDQTLLEVLRSTGFDVPSSCETGNCGTCRVKLNCGRVLHNGSALSVEEKKSEMLSCVSRGVGHIEISLSDL